MKYRLLGALVGSVAALAALTPAAGASVSAAASVLQSDLDEFMRQVLARRDENWKKLQQYVLDERERLDVRGPTDAPILGQRRE